MNYLDKIFAPKSVAIIGASRNKDKLGFHVLKNLKDLGFKGRVYPINPKAESILGIKSYSSVLDVKGRIDLAVFIVPKEVIINVFEEAAKKNIKSSIIITAGFGEIGKEGKKLEQDLLEISKKTGLRIVGPNCLGVIDTYTPLNVSFAKGMPNKKNLAVVSQSGAMCTAILDWAIKNCIGFSKFISLGNKIDVDESDIFDVFKKDKNTKVVLGYFEGINDGRKFIKKARSLSKIKPIIAIKSGQSKEGAKAASSHTGALTSDAKAVDAAFKKSGIIHVSTIEELFDFSEIFSNSVFPKNHNIAVITNAGGPGVLATDFISNSSLRLTKLSAGLKSKLKKVLPTEASVNNPIDLVGDANAKRYEEALKILLGDKNISSILLLLTPQTSTEIEKTAKTIVKFGKKVKIPIVCSFIGGTLVEKGISILEKGGIPHFEFPERAIKALASLADYHKNISMPVSLASKDGRNKKVAHILNKVAKENRSILNDKETKDVMKAIGVSVAKSYLVKSAKEAMFAAKKLGYPVVMKIVSSEVIHKTEYGLVKTGITSEKHASQSFSEIINNAKKMKINYEGIMVYEMVKSGVELIIGSKEDSSFGPVLMFGLGGTYVELFKDITHAIAPISRQEATDMIFNIKGHKLLTGFRGKEGVSIEKINKTLMAISSLVVNFPEIKELDINPLNVDGNKATALDIKIILDKK